MKKSTRKQVPTGDLPSQCLVKSSGPRQSQLEAYRLAQTVTMKHISTTRRMANEDEALLSSGTLHHRTLLTRGRHRPSSAIQSIDSRCQWQKRAASGASHPPSLVKSVALLMVLLCLSQTLTLAYGKSLSCQSADFGISFSAPGPAAARGPAALSHLGKVFN